MTKAVQIKNMEIGNGIPKICVPLTSKSEEELYTEAKKVKEAEPDLVEWRGDFFENLFQAEKCVEVAGKLREILEDIPLLFTIRTKKEGGNAEISMQEYAEINEAVAASGKVELVDIEVFEEEDEKQKLIEKIQKSGVKVIASSHDFEKTDTREVLLERFKKMDASAADILKMAVMPKELSDVAAIMQVTREMKKNFTEKPLVAMSMGELGVISRIEGEMFGSSITFAAVDAASAPGQLPIEVLRERILKFHRQLNREQR